MNISNKGINKVLSLKIGLVLFMMMLYFLVFDYRSNSEVSKYFVMFGGLASLFSGLFLMLKLRYINKHALPLVSVSFIFLIVASFSGIIRGQEIYNIASMVIPLLLFIIALIVTSAMNLKSINIQLLIKLIAIFALISVMFKLVFGFYYYDLNIENVRYQIISPSLILLFAYGMTSLLYKKQKWGNLALTLSFLVIFISVTRSYLIVFFAVTVFFILSFKLTYWFKHMNFWIKVLIFILFITIFVYFFLPDVFNRWFIRLFSSVEEQGIDVTFYTRIAEAVYQINKLMESPINLLTGLGIAAETKFAPEFTKILSIVFSGDYEYTGMGYGHNTYIGIVFTGGVLFGGLFIYYMISISLKNILFFRSLLKKNQELSDYYFIIAWGGSAALGYCIYGFLGGTFGDRMASLSFGLAFGLIFLGKRYVLQNAR